MPRACVAVLAAMPNELRPFVRELGLPRAAPSDPWRHRGPVGPIDVIATTTGIGTAAARRTTEDILAAADVDHVVMIGIAGGMAPAVAVGDVVVPEVVLDASGRAFHPEPLAGAVASGILSTSDDLLSDAEALAILAADGVVALDMETASVGAACEDRGVRWSVFRAISDIAGATALDDAVLRLARPDGSPDLGAAAKFVVTRPWRLPGLARLARDSTRAATAAARAAAHACRAWPRDR